MRLHDTLPSLTRGVGGESTSGWLVAKGKMEKTETWPLPDPGGVMEKAEWGREEDETGEEKGTRAGPLSTEGEAIVVTWTRVRRSPLLPVGGCVF